MTDTPTLKTLVAELEKAEQAAHGNADENYRRIWIERARAEAAEAERDTLKEEVASLYRSISGMAERCALLRVQTEAAEAERDMLSDREAQNIMQDIIRADKRIDALQAENLKLRSVLGRVDQLIQRRIAYSMDLPDSRAASMVRSAINTEKEGE